MIDAPIRDGNAKYVDVHHPATNDQSRGLVFPGSFAPLHRGHLEMANYANDRLDVPIWFELSISNVDKALLSTEDVDQRCAQDFGRHGLVLTNAPTFLEKARVFPGSRFIVGADTVLRIDDLRYYKEDSGVRSAVLQELQAIGVRFLVFPRQVGNILLKRSNLGLSEQLRSLCDFVPVDLFRIDISSSSIRKENGIQ